MTVVWLDSSTDLPELAAEVVRRTSLGEVVLIPTETQYGLCCNSESSGSMSHLIAIKGKSYDQPSAVFVRDWSHASRLVKAAPANIKRFIGRFWPGPLTVVCSASMSDWPGIISSRGTIGLRCSSHPLLGHVVSSEAYLTATSANPHDRPPSADPDELTNWLAKDVELLIFDRGIMKSALASTVVDISSGKPVILREGLIKATEIETAWIEETQK